MHAHFYVIDTKDYTIKTVNSAAGLDKITEKTTCYALTHKRKSPCDGAEHICPIQKVKQTRKPVIVEHIHYDKEGTRIDTVHAFPIFDSNGNITQIIEYNLDITEQKKVEEDIKKVSGEWNGTFDSISDMIFITDKNFRFVKANKATYNILKKKPEELIGNLCYEIIHDMKKPLRDCPHAKALETKKPAAAEIVDPNLGIPLWVSVSPIFDNNGKIMETVHVIKDLTERKQMENELKHYSENLEELVNKKTKELKKSELFLQSTIQSVPDHMYIKDKDFKLIFVNDSYCDLHGRSEDEIIGSDAYDLYPKEEADAFTQQDREVFEKGKSILTDDYSRTYPDGSKHILQTLKTPIRDPEGNITCMVGITRDITERKSLEKMKDQLISAATHELRTPLVSIKGYLDMVLIDKRDQISKKVESDLEVVNRNIDRLMNITDDLLEIRNIESGKLQLNLEPLDINKIIKNNVKKIQPFLKKKQTFNIETPGTPLPIQGDRIRLNQILMNLLSNASKFTPEDEKIILKVIEEADHIKVQVSDTRIGISKNKLDMIFEPFADIKKSAYFKGTGLGLSVTKSLVEAHGGKIWVEYADECKGATFTFTLPKGERRLF